MSTYLSALFKNTNIGVGGGALNLGELQTVRRIMTGSGKFPELYPLSSEILLVCSAQNIILEGDGAAFLRH